MLNQSFLDDVARFQDELRSVSSVDDLRALWQRQVAPYRIASSEPLSEQYKEEILNLYKKIAGTSYELPNELMSTKVPPSDFVRGYPWMTSDFGIAAAELMKVVQAFRVLKVFAPDVKRVVEFGSGWANLAVALAQIGLDVTAIDIDGGFVARTENLAKRHDLQIHTIRADFIAAARAMNGDFEAVIFQSSFHHCLDFNELLGLLRARALTPRGLVFFFSEPIFSGYSFPWGLRLDGESLWAVTNNKWCELGFDRDFFVTLLHAHGFLGTETGGIPGVIGDAWVATPSELGLRFEDWALPGRYDETFHATRDVGQGRFLRERSILPVPREKCARLSLINYAPFQLKADFVSGVAKADVTVGPGAEMEVVLNDVVGEISMRCETFIPDDAYGSGDIRRVGLSLRHVWFS